MATSRFKPASLTLVLVVAMFGMTGAAFAQNDNPDNDDGNRPPPPPPMEGSLMQLSPGQGVVGFRQVVWDFDNVRMGLSDWGEVVVDPYAVGEMMRVPPEPVPPPKPPHPGRDPWNCPPPQIARDNIHNMYINVLLYVPGGKMPYWAVNNLHVPSTMCDDAPPPNQPRQALTRYLDLRPADEAFMGRIRVADATVLLSEQPIPPTEEVREGIMRTFKPKRFFVGYFVENAEGMQPDQLLNTTPPRAINQRWPLGQPPQPFTPQFDIDDLVFPLCVLQEDAPNIQCAKNQCVPMAQANAIQYLEDRYDGAFLRWDLPQLAVPGFGMQTAAGDVVYWVPVPVYSVVANVDFFTRRTGVFDADSGSGSSICQLYRGLFGYLELAEPFTNASFWHQGTNAPQIGDGTTCDTVTIDLGGRVSTRVGENPTFDWIYNQLSFGRAVTICFGRYDSDGNRTSGHCVRVWGACKMGSKRTLYTLDDGNQGSNNYGLRTQQWDVADTGSPGNNPGPPDGRLNMDGMSWEIEFANSIEAHPTFAFDIFFP